MVGHVVQARLGVAPRGDVLRLQDQAGRARGAPREVAAMQRDPHLVPLGMPAAQFDGGGLYLLAHHAAQLFAQRVHVGHVEEGVEVAPDHVTLGVPEQGAQSGVDLQHLAFGGHQRHADGGMRERAVEAPLAVLQLHHVLGRLRRLAFCRFDPHAGCGDVGLALAEVVVQHRQQHADDGHRGCDHGNAELARHQEQQRRDQRAGGIGDADPAEVAEEVGQAQRLVALEVDDQSDQQGVEQKVADRKAHRRDQHHRVVERAQRAQPVEHSVQRPADHRHRDGGHRRAGEPAGPAFGAARRADEGFARGRQCGRGGPVHQQQQEDEDLAGGEGVFRARHAHRVQARQHRHHAAHQHLQQAFPGQAGDGEGRADQRRGAQQDHGPPVQRGLAVVVGHQRGLHAAPPGGGACIGVCIDGSDIHGSVVRGFQPARPGPGGTRAASIHSLSVVPPEN